jgi:pimeloyl-ACP methyl ester carboxylesterase
MELHARDFGGEGTTLLLLHGLFGSSSNWGSMGKRLSGSARVFALDLRNHGSSPHEEPHTVPAMGADVMEWLDRKGLARAWVLGHSMGGQVAMHLALQHPDRVAGLIVVDIAPRPYRIDRSAELAALSVDVSGMGDRKSIDRAMAEHVSDAATRGFLQMNLARTQEGFHWRPAVGILSRARDHAVSYSGSYGGPALFLIGERSDYVDDTDWETIQALFPLARIEVVPGADHWVHHSRPDEFAATVDAFLGGEQDG